MLSQFCIGAVTSFAMTSSAAGSTASKFDVALATFGKKGGSGKKGGGSGEACSSSKKATEKQAQQKRDAAKRDRLLATAPAHVKEKWAVICGIKGRDHAKNQKKAEFLQKLFGDNSFQDCYWQQTVTDTYVKSHGGKGKWILRAKADTDHGGGDAGHKAVQDAIDCGKYFSREYKAKDKFGKICTIEEVCINEGVEMMMHHAGFENKSRAGGIGNEESFKNQMMDSFGETGA